MQLPSFFLLQPPLLLVYRLVLAGILGEKAQGYCPTTAGYDQSGF